MGNNIMNRPIQSQFATIISVFLLIALMSISFLLPQDTYAQNSQLIKTIPADETKIHIAESQTPAPPSAKILSAELRTKKQARTLATT